MASQLAAHGVMYERLPVDETHIRALLLHPDPSGIAPLSCSLEVITLDPKPTKPYLALSYVWGDPSIKENITLNGIAFAVTTNLAKALRQLRRNFGKVLLWADAVCINQEDTLERTQQVMLMRQIYSKAGRVVAWLGPDENGGSRALRALETLFRNGLQHPDNFEWIKRMPELFTPNKTYRLSNGKTDRTNDLLDQLLALLKRPFWRRVWIVQELVLCPNLMLFCGDASMVIPEPSLFTNAVNRLARFSQNRPASLPLPMFMKLVECMAALKFVANSRLRFHNQQQLQADHGSGEISGFIDARIFMEYHKTTDPRDHVYALLGLINLDVIPDYREGVSAGDVYLEVARRGLTTKPVDILSFAGTWNSYTGSDRPAQLDSPSWVPDWRINIPTRTRTCRYPESHAFPSSYDPQVQIVGNRWLRWKAVVWDTILRTEHKTGWDLTEWDVTEKIDIGSPDDLAYPSGISRFQAIILLWMGGFEETGGKYFDMKVNSKFFTSYGTIFYSKIAGLWASRHGRENVHKLWFQFFGQNRPALPPNGHREAYVVASRQLRYAMRCFHTEKGYIGFGQLSTQAGDVVCVLEGHKAPIILRKRESHYIVVGDCDVVGIMNGEVLNAVEQDRAKIVNIEIH